ncbi:MAG: helix-hairpin-helix domain-containing protein [Flavobacterium sp.]|nr:helix-hairpin-helix domain-containing protein [Flavobacterium sp.]
MKSPSLKLLFTYTAAQRRGLLLLTSILLLMQVLHFIDLRPTSENSPERMNWLALQPKIDSMKSATREIRQIYPFNPNFITDFKGYTLGLSVAEIDRLHAFRKQNRYVNSAAEFQQVTKVSDSLLATLSPFFKFPDWVTNRKPSPKFQYRSPEKIVVTDINNATAEDLIKVYGIGPALSERILKMRSSLGGFVDMKQMADVWGLSPEVIENLMVHFTVSKLPDINKIQINSASIKELAQFPYFRYALAKQIVTYRSMNGDIKNAADLTKIKGFPVEKADIIALYLEF